VECHADSLRAIRKNLAATGFTDRCELLALDLLKALRLCARRCDLFDLVFLDPPYGEKGLTEATLRYIGEQPLLTERGVMILETSRDGRPLVPSRHHLLDTRVYGDTALHFITCNCPEDSRPGTKTD
jgi:16S rRNA G966 N2-methylase RsmD